MNGYSSDFKNKGKRVATLAQLDDFGVSVLADLVNLSITQEQHKKILHYLDKQQSAEQGELSGGSSSLGLAVTSHMAGNFCLASSMIPKWILDSGASNHMYADISMFKSYSKLHVDRLITIPDEKKLKVEHTGTIFLKSGITLNNVLHVPGPFFDQSNSAW
uniref:Retrovirus-related Pol polyprotein from transposon TNT 1-94-like beta-barrel domain-containing protein n=1 Tax=Chenopodium quinoa TaxID=63459 RepID=A0A803N8T2_CHEQI